MIQDPNEATIDAYNRQAGEYIIKTPSNHDLPSHQWLKRWIDKVLTHVKPSGQVLEIGSATPRDARYIRQQGFTVQCSDAADSFLEYLSSQGEHPIRLNIVKDKIRDKYDLIFTNAALPHLTDEQFEIALDNMHNALNEGGIIAFNLKEGTGEAWINEKFAEKRYINYWHTHTVEKLVKKHGFKIVSADDKIKGDLPTHLWIHIIAQKITK